MTVESKHAIALHLMLVAFLIGSKTGEVIALVYLAVMWLTTETKRGVDFGWVCFLVS